MHRDHKLAVSLGLLLIGVAAALCFPREEPDDLASLQLENVDQLDAAIDLLPVRVYTEGHESTDGDDQVEDQPDAPPEDVGETLKDPFAEFALLPAAPDPIPLADVSRAGGGPVRASEPPATHFGHVESWPVDDDEPASTIAPRAADEEGRAGSLFYVVQPGDTLSGLAGRFLGSTRRFLDLYDANRDVLSSPDDLQIGMRLSIPARTGATDRGADAWPQSSGTRPTFQPVRERRELGL